MTDHILSLIGVYSDRPHILIPRSGRCIYHAIDCIGVSSFVEWRYDCGMPEHILRSPVATSVSKGLSRELAFKWKDEAYGALFPDILYLPENTSPVFFSKMTTLCGNRRNSSPHTPENSTGFKKALSGLDWVIAPLHVAPFMHDEPTYYCIVLSNDSVVIELIEIEMLNFGVETFRLTRGSIQWPIPDDAEYTAERLWEQELIVT